MMLEGSPTVVIVHSLLKSFGIRFFANMIMISLIIAKESNEFYVLHIKTSDHPSLLIVQFIS